MSSSDAQSLSAYKKVFVAGGTRGLGRIIVDKLLKSGSEVVALVRSDSSLDELNAIDGVTAIKGDAFDYKQIEDAMDGCDAAITTLGKSPNDEGEDRIDYTGNANVVEAAGILGVTRVVLVTSIGCGNSKEAITPAIYEVLSEALVAKQKAENVLMKYYTNTNWTVIRPGGLKSEKATGTAILTEDNLASGSIHREDVASLVLTALTSEKTMRKILSAVDPELVSSSTEGKVVEAFQV